MSGDAWAEGQDGHHAIYRERLYPPVVIVALAIALAAIVGVAYSAAYGAAAGWLTGGMVAAGALVTPGKRVPSRQLWAGSPAKLMRELSDEEIADFAWTVERYVAHGGAYREAIAAL